jgi:5-methyltetrahydrofolate--homocysteine methyltransferase
MNLFRPHLVRAEGKLMGRVIVDTGRGDLHDIRKNLACLMLDGSAFELVDLGVDVQRNSSFRPFEPAVAR